MCRINSAISASLPSISARWSQAPNFAANSKTASKAVLKEITESNGEIICFIDELHTLVGAGGSEGAIDAANMLKPALARGELRCIGATTLTEYRKYVEKDAALARRFQTVLVGEPTVDDTIAILRGLKEKFEIHHSVRIKDSAIVAAAVLLAPLHHQSLLAR